MTSCDRCGGYVSPDYVRVFGDNQNRIDSCPECRTNGTKRTREEPSEESERGLTFRMSEFETEDGERDGSEASTTTGRSRLGRVSAAVSELF